MTPGAAAQVADHAVLLSALAEDAHSADRLWRAAPYWRPYCDRILRELGRIGLRDFRSNPNIVKGYAPTGVAEPVVPATGWKRAVWHLLERAPGFARIVAAYRQLLLAEAGTRRYMSIQLARVALDAVAERHPRFAPPRGIANGAPWDAFEWRGHQISADWAVYVARAADFYAKVPPEQVTGLIEIGPGLGLSTLAHAALNPNLRVAVHVDIVPVIYVSTQYLASCPGLHVVDYLETRTMVPIRVAARNGLTVYQLAPWQLPRLQGSVDFFFNAFSFQEMNREICANYARHLCQLAAGGGLIHASVMGDDLPPRARRMHKILPYLEELFARDFPRIARVGGLWPTYFGADPEQTRLFLR